MALPVTLQQHSRLLNLAAELRNRIYEFALPYNNISIDRYVDDYDESGDLEIREVKNSVKYPALLQSCRQTRAEASPMWFANVNIIWIRARHLWDFLESLGARYQLVRTLEHQLVYANEKTARACSLVMIRRFLRKRNIMLVEGALVGQYYTERFGWQVAKIRG